MSEMKDDFEMQADFRRQKAIEYPNDSRNLDAAKLLDQLATSAHTMPSDLHAAWQRIFERHDTAASEEWSRMLLDVGFRRWPENAQTFVREFIMSMPDAPPMTVRQWLDIHKDLDGYIARGGSLLELPLNPIDDKLPAFTAKMIERELGSQLGSERIERLGRYCTAVGDAVLAFGPDARIGDVLDEDQLREIWRKTAN